MLVVPWVTQAQTLSEYTFSTGVDTSRWITLSSPSNVFTSYSDDVASSVYNMGFTFPFGEGTYSQFSVSSNGIFKLGPDAASTGTTAGQFTSSYYTTSLPKICGIARDMSTGSNGYVHYQMTGSAPYRVFVCEFALSYTYGSSYAGDVKWQVQLHEDSSKVVIVYAPTAPTTTPSSFQTGLAETSNDIIIINPSTNQPIYCTSSHSTTYSTWHGAGRYYEFVRPIITCPRTSELVQTDATLNSVTVSWTEMGSATQWVLEYDSVDFVPGTNSGILEYVTSVPYTINNLDSAHTYYIYVHADCGGDTSLNRFLEARTLATSPTTIPFICDFEGDGDNGWEMINGNQPNIWYIGSAVNNGGSKSLYISNNSGTSNAYTTSTISYAYAYRTIEFSDSGEFVYSYDWRSQGESHNYDFSRVFLSPAGYQWVANDNPAGSTYNFASWSCPSGWIELTEQFGSPANLSQSSSWRTATGSFRLNHPGTYNLVFAWANDASGGSQPPTAIDNVIIFRNTCPAPEVAVDQVTSSSITLSWIPGGDETSWLVISDSIELVVFDTFYVFDELLPNTVHHFSVRALCGSDDTSMFSSITVRTACGSLNLPYIENFDAVPGSTSTSVPVNNLPPCWNYLNHGTRTDYMGYPIVYTGSAHSGSNCMRFYSFYTAADSNQYAILPMIDSTQFPVNGMKLSFQMKANSSSSGYGAVAIVGVMTNPTDHRTFVPVDTVSSTGSTTYSAYEVYFSSYTGPHGQVAIIFPQPSHLGLQYNYGYVDDIVLDVIPDCLPVINLSASNITGNSANIMWSDTTNSSSWTIEYGVSGFVLGTGTIDNAYDTSYTITGLSPNTNYDVYVTPNCSSGLAGTAYFTFRTECGAIDILPFFENFESYPDGASSYAPPDCGIPCWKRLDNSTQYHFGYIGARSSWPTGGHSGTGFLYYYMPTTTGTYADWIITVLPPINTTLHPVNTLQLSFWVKMNSASTQGDIVIGVMTDPTVDSTFVPVDTVHVAGNDYDMKEAYLSSYTDTGAYIAMRYTRNSGTTTYYFVDDITVEPIPACPPVSNISLAGLDSNMISVTWSENGNATTWDVEYGEAGFTLGTGTTVTATSLPLVINGLTPATLYDIYVTPTCTEGASATRMATFRTANAYIALPFSCGFEDTAQNSLWSLENGTNTNKWHIGTATHNSGTHALYISDNNGTANSYTISSSTVDYAYVDVMIPSTGDYG